MKRCRERASAAPRWAAPRSTSAPQKPLPCRHEDSQQRGYGSKRLMRDRVTDVQRRLRRHRASVRPYGGGTTVLPVWLRLAKRTRARVGYRHPVSVAVYDLRDADNVESKRVRCLPRARLSRGLCDIAHPPARPWATEYPANEANEPTRFSRRSIAQLIDLPHSARQFLTTLRCSTIVRTQKTTEKL